MSNMAIDAAAVDTTCLVLINRLTVEEVSWIYEAVNRDPLEGVLFREVFLRTLREISRRHLLFGHPLELPLEAIATWIRAFRVAYMQGNAPPAVCCTRCSYLQGGLQTTCILCGETVGRDEWGMQRATQAMLNRADR